MKNKELIKKLNLILKNSKLRMFILGLLSIISSTITISIAFIIKYAIKALESGIFMDKLILYIVLFSIAVLVLLVISFINSLLTQKYKIETEKSLRSYAFKELISSEYTDIIKYENGDIITRYNNDIGLISNNYITLLPSFINTIFMIVGVVISLYIVSPIFSILIMLSGIIISLVYFFIRKVVIKLYKDMMKSKSDLTSSTSDFISSSLLIKTTRKEELFIDKENELIDDYINKKKKRGYFSAVFSSIFSISYYFLYLIIILYGIYKISDGSGLIDYAILISSIELLSQIKGPISRISGYSHLYNEITISIKRLFEIGTNNKIDLIHLDDFNKISINNISFKYQDKEIIKDLSFEIDKGDKVLIKGESGIGKSTLINLISGVLKLDSGRIDVIYNNDSYDPRNIEGLFSYVPQENMLFSTTVLENIKLFSLNDDLLDKSISISNIDKSILDNNISSSNGTGVSIGEGRRVSIARAINDNKKILLFDEGTSSIDKDNIKEILDKLFSIKDLTIIASSHDDLILEYVNKIIEL